MRTASLRTTIKINERRQNEDYLRVVQRYAMRRYTTSWAQRHYKLASMWFTAADRCSRLCRLLTRGKPAKGMLSA